MSGFANLLARGLTDDLAILTSNGMQLKAWKRAQVTRGLEGFPSSFEFVASEIFPGDASRTFVQAGDPCEVTLGADTVITGFVDAVTYQIQPGRHDIVIQGRGKCQDLVDCSADLSSAGLQGGQINNTDAIRLATTLAQPFKITVRNLSKHPPAKIDSIEVALGETPFEIIERAARFSSLIVYENEKGELVIDDVGTETMASGFAQGVNVQAGTVTFSMQDRFSDYTVLWQSIDTLKQIGASANYRASGKDGGVPRYRPKIIVSEQWTPDFDFGKRRIEWEIARRYGRSQAAMVTCDSWRDQGLQLWQVNRLAPIQMPAWSIGNTNWLIGGITFHKDESGTRTDVLLMPPAAFSPEPNILKPFDRQIGQDLNNPSAPAPPSINTPPAGP